MNALGIIFSSVILLGAVQIAYDPRPDLEAGRYLKALSEAENQLKTNPSDAMAMATKAQALSALFRFDEALTLAERALSLQPKLADALLARGLARGGAAIQQRNFGSIRKASKALDDFEAATALDPKLVQAWISLGLAYQQMPGILGGSTRKALQSADQLRNVNAAKGELLRGMVLSLDGRWKDAEPCFQRALTAAPSDAQIVSGYLDSLSSRETRKTLGDASQRTKLYTEARRLLPGVKTQARGVEAVSLALLDASEHEEAWRIAKDALSQVESPSILRLHLGKIAARAGIHREEGLTFLDQVLREPLEGGTGGYPAAHWRRGQILKDLGRKAEAKAAAEAALKLDPKHPGALRVIEEMNSEL